MRSISLTPREKNKVVAYRRMVNVGRVIIAIEQLANVQIAVVVLNNDIVRNPDRHGNERGERGDFLPTN
jgi:hypothetical protein